LHPQELAFMQESLQNLKMAQQKFQESSDCMDRVKPESENKEILVPLTGSVSFYGIIIIPVLRPRKEFTRIVASFIRFIFY